MSRMSNTGEWPVNIVCAILGDRAIREEDLPEDIEGVLAYLMSRLTEKERIMVNMRFREKAGYEAIGAAVGLGAGSVGSRMSNVLRKLGGNGGEHMLRDGMQDRLEGVPEWPVNAVNEVLRRAGGDAEGGEPEDLSREELPGDIEGTFEYLLCRLTDRERDVLEMHYKMGVSYQEIGSTTPTEINLGRGLRRGKPAAASRDWPE